MSRMLLVAVALAVVLHFRQSAFVPPPARRAASLAVPAIAAAAASAPAFADEFDTAARKLSVASYPFLKNVNWESNAYLVKPGSAPASEWIKAIDKAIVMGASMDPTLLKKGVMAHHKAVLTTSEGGPLCGQGDYELILAALGRMIASVPESQVMDVYNSFAALVDPGVPPFLMSTVNAVNARAAYAGLLQFKDVVKANPIAPNVLPTSPDLTSKLGAIDGAAAKLSSAAYPFLKDVDWSSDLALKPLPGVTTNQVLKAIDKALVMGASMDGKLLKSAAEAHHKAIGSIDAKLVTSEADFAAINAALGKAIASVPTSQVMDVYNAFAKIVNPVIPNYLYSSVNPADAQAAYAALLSFKDVVKAAQR